MAGGLFARWPVPVKPVLRRRPVVSWALYDWGNSAFATTVMAGFFPVFFKEYWNAGVVATESTFRLGLTYGLSSLIIAVLAPVLGAIADRSGARVRMLMAFTLLGSAATAGLALVGQGQWIAAVALYLAASLGFWGGIMFNDSMLLYVAEPDEFDLVSGPRNPVRPKWASGTGPHSIKHILVADCV